MNKEDLVYNNDGVEMKKFYTCDGKICFSIEEVMQYNQAYYDNLVLHEYGDCEDKPMSR